MSAGVPGTGRRLDIDETGLRHRARRRTLRASVYAASLALVAWAAWTVPLPYTEFVPGEPTSIQPLIEVEGADTTDLDGDTALLTVLLQQTTTRTAIGALLDGDRRLRPTQEILPEDVDREEFLEQERQRFRDQFEVAAAVGAEAAGVEVTVTTAALVAGVVPGGPAEGHLQPGDVVTSVDGTPIDGAPALQRAVRRHEVGDTITIGFEREGEEHQAEIELEPLGHPEGAPTTEPPDDAGDQHPDGEAQDDIDEDTPGIGVLVETVAERVELPFELRLAETRIGGPSAGLMVALTVYDLLADEDLLDGRVVHGTGSIDAGGVVGRVGGVPEKMRATHDADLVLVPASLLEEARANAPDGVEVAGVETFDDALRAVRESR